MVSKATGVYAKFKAYIKDNWGAPFVVGFIALLAFSTVYSTTSQSLADALSISAYYTLVAGIVLQITCFWKSNKKGENNGSN